MYCFNNCLHADCLLKDYKQRFERSSKFGFTFGADKRPQHGGDCFFGADADETRCRSLDNETRQPSRVTIRSVAGRGDDDAAVRALVGRALGAAAKVNF